MLVFTMAKMTARYPDTFISSVDYWNTVSAFQNCEFLLKRPLTFHKTMAVANHIRLGKLNQKLPA